MKILKGILASLAVSFLLVSGCDSCIATTGALNITMGMEQQGGPPCGGGWPFIVSGPGGFSKTSSVIVTAGPPQPVPPSMTKLAGGSFGCYGQTALTGLAPGSYTIKHNIDGGGYVDTCGPQMITAGNITSVAIWYPGVCGNY